MMKALLIVDLQRDFCPGGALPAAKANHIVPVINNLMGKFEHVIASRDWHPEESVHFSVWPKHCIRHSEGAKFHPDLQVDQIKQTFLKGTEGKDDGYSAFEATNKNLNEYLGQNQIDQLFITGLTTEYCVKETALDAVRNNIDTYVIRDAVAAVNKEKGDEGKAFAEMEEKGVRLIFSTKIK
ncbi:MAG: isochorismatase family protein [Bacteroidales bacterium]|nr:isochorismatase family protein [Bacteroidales bacterium]